MKKTIFVSLLAVLMIMLATITVGCDNSPPINSHPDDVAEEIQNPQDYPPEEPPEPTSPPEEVTEEPGLGEGILQDNPPEEPPEEQSSSVIENDSLFLPILLNIEPRITDSGILWGYYDSFPEFAAMFDLFLSETGLSYEDLAFQQSEGMQVIYFNSTGSDTSTPIEIRSLAVEHYDINIASIRFQDIIPIVAEREGAGLNTISFGSSEVEMIEGEWAIVSFVVTGRTSSGAIIRVADIDITGSYIVWVPHIGEIIRNN